MIILTYILHTAKPETHKEFPTPGKTRSVFTGEIAGSTRLDHYIQSPIFHFVISGIDC